MSSKISVKQLRAAATIVESRMLAEIDTNEISPHEFSEAFEHKMKPVLKKAGNITPSKQEVEENPRSRSARLRYAIKL